MSDEPPVPPEPLPAHHSQPPRPPVPGWMWAVCGFGLVPVGFLWGAIVTYMPTPTPPKSDVLEAALSGAALALIPGAAWCLGLLLAKRFHSGDTARIVSALVFGIAIFIGTTAVIFAGCMCVVFGHAYH